PAADPVDDELDFLVGERRPLLRHLRHGAADHLDEQALGRIAGEEHRALVAAGHGAGMGAEIEAAARFRAVVAWQAALLEDRRDLLGEEALVRLWAFRLREADSGEDDEAQSKAER